MKRILFVEDDALIARVYSQKLAEAGYEVTLAEDGLVAMKRLVESVPDLVVLDLMMPKLSGVDVLKFMRRNQSLKATKVIIFSSSFLGGLIEQVGTTGVEKVLIKSSATPAELLDAIEEVFLGPVHPVRDPPKVPAPSPPAPAAPALTKPEAIHFPGAIPGAAAPPGTSAPGEQLVPDAPNKTQPDSRARVRLEFLKNGDAAIAGLRRLCRDFVEAAELPEQTARLADLHRKARFLTQMAAVAECPRFARLSNGLEALAFELQEKTKFINDSTRQTMAATVGLLADLFQRLDDPEETAPAPQPQVLVVDDDAVTNRAVVFALNRLDIKPASVTDPLEALQKLQETAFDLVLLDINMPGMDGLTVCEKLRALPAHRHTPVVFVTSQNDFKTRARSLLCGGNDFISKPILPVELCVKAITHLLARSSSKSGVASSGGSGSKRD